MYNGDGIRVYYSSRTIGGFKGREGMGPVCYSCEKALGIKHNYETMEAIPSEVMPLVFSAHLASEELGIRFRLVDVNQLSIIHRLIESVNGKPVPRVSIGKEFITGCLTKQDIIDFHRRVRGIPR
ncbi:MAG: hypothetical protein ACFFAY_02530 [Promethearchaeota archaeon]